MTSLALARSSEVRVRTLLALGVVYLVWSSTYLVLRSVVLAIPPMLAGGARFLSAALLLFLLQRARSEPAPSRASWRYAAGSGVLLFAVANGLVGIAEVKVASGVAAVACAATPLMVALLGRLFGERSTRRELLGIALGFAGVMVLGAGSDLRSAGPRGILLLVSPVAWAMGTVIARRFRAPSALTFGAQQMLCGGVAMLLAGGLLGERWPSYVPPEALGALGFLVLFGSVLAFPAYGYLVANARPSVATSYAYVNPVIAVILGAALGGESIGRATLLALATVVAAVLVMASGRGVGVSGRPAR